MVKIRKKVVPISITAASWVKMPKMTCGIKTHSSDAFHPLCADMESAAVAHVCHANGIPFLSIRTITDSADRSAAACFEENCRRASEIAAQVTHALFKRLAAGGPCLIAKGELP